MGKTGLKMIGTKIFVRKFSYAKRFHFTKIRFSAEIHTATPHEHPAQCLRGDPKKRTSPSIFALTALRIHPMKSAATKKSPVLFASVAFILVYAVVDVHSHFTRGPVAHLVHYFKGHPRKLAVSAETRRVAHSPKISHIFCRAESLHLQRAHPPEHWSSQ